MKTSLRIASVTALLAGMSMLPAFAQSLSFSGNVQICQSAAAGSACTPATPGMTVQAGTHLMVGPGGSASVTYENGAVVNFTEPGLYTINAAPAGALAPGQTMSAGSVVAANTGFIVFAGLIAAAGIASSTLDDDEDLLVPISE